MSIIKGQGHFSILEAHAYNVTLSQWLIYICMSEYSILYGPSWAVVLNIYYNGFHDLPDRGEADRVLRVGGDGGAGQRHAGQT